MLRFTFQKENGTETFSVSTEILLIKQLTRINRMDIVHLIDTKTTELTQEETSSHTYAEIEQTIALDHTEGTYRPSCGEAQTTGNQRALQPDQYDTVSPTVPVRNNFTRKPLTGKSCKKPPEEAQTRAPSLRSDTSAGGS